MGLQYGLDAYSPVDDNGRFTEEVDFFRASSFSRPTTTSTRRLQDKGALLAKAEHQPIRIPTAGGASNR